MASRIKFNDPMPQIRDEMRRRLTTVAIIVQNHAKTLISTDGTVVRGSNGPTRNAKGQFLKRKGTLQYDANPSKPGDPPNVQRGRLRASIAWVVEGMSARVGTNLKYGKFLELGTRFTAPRPWLYRSLRECSKQIIAVMTAPFSLKN